MQSDKSAELDLDALFAQAAEVEHNPSAALMARVLADAAREQPQPVPVSRAAPVPKPGWLAGLSDLLGGMRGMAGLSLAGVAGLYLGVAQPAGLADFAAVMTGASASVEMDLLPGNGTLWSEQ